MKPHAIVEITAGTLRDMTMEQLVALRQNVLADGNWETVNSCRISGIDPVGVNIGRMFIGIERDGYTHS